MSSNTETQDRFTEEDANNLFAYDPGNPDDPAFFRDFLSTFKQVPGHLAPPHPNADLKLPFYIQCNISRSLPKSPNDTSVQKAVVNGTTAIPLGAVIRGIQDPLFLRKAGNEAFSSLRDGCMRSVSDKLKCVCCGEAHTQSTKMVQAAILGIPATQSSGITPVQVDSICGLTLLVDPFYFLCSKPKCMAEVMRAKEMVTPNAALRMCYHCNRYEDPSNLMKTCSRCKAVFYCDAIHQKAHWPIHKTMCRQIAKK